MTLRLRTAIVLGGLLLLGAAAARAQLQTQAGSVPAGTVPGGINYQGRLMDNGFPVTGTRSVSFRLYDAATGGALLWSSGAQSVVATQGVFGATLSISTGPLSGSARKYLEVQVDNTTLSPREPLNAVPYALVAKSLEDQVTIASVTVGSQLISSGTLSVTTIAALPGTAGVRVSTSVIVESAYPQTQLRNTSQALPAGLYRWAAPGDYVTLEKNGSGAGDWSALSELLRVTSAGSLGLGTGAPGYRLDVQGGQINASGGLCIAGVCQTGWAGVSGVTGAGTAGYVTRWTGGSTIGNSALVDGGTGMTVTGGSTLTVTGGGFSVGGSSFVVAAGNVGVGTTNPAAAFHVVGSEARFQRAGGFQLVLEDSTGGADIQNITFTRSGATKSTIFNNASNQLTFQTDNADLRFKTSGADERARITSGGALGLGTTSPAARLHLSSANAAASDTIMQVSSGTNAGQELLVVKGDGKVGVGTTSPASKLHVLDGDIRVSTSAGQPSKGIVFQDGSVQTTAAGGTGGGWTDTGSVVQLATPTDTIGSTGAGVTVSTHLIVSAGNFGIGTSGPGHQFQIGTHFNGTVANAKMFVEAGAYNAWNGKIAVSPDGNAAVASVISSYHDNTLNIQKLGLGTIGYSGVEQTMVLQNGNVGIGTTSPVTRLHVEGAGLANSELRVNDTAGQGLVRVQGTTGASVFLQDNAGGGVTYQVDSGAEAPGKFTITHNGVARRLTIDSTGNVGVGTTSPGAKLDVAGHQLFSVAGASITFNAGGPTIGVPMGNTLAFGTSGIERMRLDNLGNFGIGTTNPAAKLDVSGNISLAYNSGATTASLIRSYAAAHQPGDVPNTTRFGMTDGPGFGAGTFAGMMVNGALDGAFNSYSLAFNTHHGGVSAGTRMTIDKAGNVGIGTTGPNGLLDVAGAVYVRNNTSGGTFRTVSIGASGNGYGSVGYGVRYTAAGDAFNYDNTDLASQLRFQAGGFEFMTAPSGTAGNPITFTKAMVIQQGGNVGIGTTSPANALDVGGSSGGAMRIDGRGAFFLAAEAACLASGINDRFLVWSAGTAATCATACAAITCGTAASCVQGWTAWAGTSHYRYGTECTSADPSGGQGISGKLCCCTGTGCGQTMYR